MPKRFTALLLPFVTVFALGAAMHARADGGTVVRFATLPKSQPGLPKPGFPEGIAADPIGRIYVATFDFSQPNVIYIFDRDGHIDETLALPAGVVPLGLEFRAGKLYVANFAGGSVLKFEPPFTSGSIAAETFQVCGGVSAGCGLNAITFDRRGDLYVSDSFGGNVFKVDLRNSEVTTYVSNALLQPGGGFPPFGANGLAFDHGDNNLYIANTAQDRVLKYNVRTNSLTIFAESVNGADGIAFDSSGRLWVAANQADEVVALNANGQAVERRGSFQGIGPDGAAIGLLFPASIAISRGAIYVTNLALPLTPTVGDEPEEDVTTYTVSRFRLSN